MTKCQLIQNTRPQMIFWEDFTLIGVLVAKLKDCNVKNYHSNQFISVIHEPTVIACLSEIFSNDQVSVIANNIIEIFHTYRCIIG